MTAAQNKLIAVGGKQFTVWTGPAGPIAVTTAALNTRMGFRRVPLTSKSAKVAISKVTGPKCICGPVRHWDCAACNHADAERRAKATGSAA